MFSTSRKLLGSLTLFTFIFAFAIPLLVMIESAKAGPNVIYVRDHTTYYVCRCPDRPLWIIVDCWVDERREIDYINHPDPIIVDWEPQHVFHNVTYNWLDTWENVTLNSDNPKCGTIVKVCEEH